MLFDSIHIQAEHFPSLCKGPERLKISIRFVPLCHEPSAVFDVCCLLFDVLTTSKIIKGQAPICDSVHSWRFYSAAPLGSHASITISCHPTQSHYADAEGTSPCPLLIMPCAWLGNEKFQFWCRCFLSIRVQTHKLRVPWSPKVGDGHSTHLAFTSGVTCLIQMRYIYIFI